MADWRKTRKQLTRWHCKGYSYITFYFFALITSVFTSAVQTIDMADETRASRDRLAIQLGESDRAKIKAEAGEAAAIAKHKEIERQNCCMEGMLTASRQEAQMWRTKLNTSTERAKLQKLQKELGVQGLEMLEVEKRCADRLKVPSNISR